MRPDIPVNDLSSRRVHGHTAGAKDHSVGHDGLTVDAFETLRSLVRGNHLSMAISGAFVERVGGPKRETTLLCFQSRGNSGKMPAVSPLQKLFADMRRRGTGRSSSAEK